MVESNWFYQTHTHRRRHVKAWRVLPGSLSYRDEIHKPCHVAVHRHEKRTLSRKPGAEIFTPYGLHKGLSSPTRSGPHHMRMEWESWS
ncbi:hypothetical protein DPEC_G00293420 [Dallia pectoralis]|uniref:Uncharacterized protein n=1 Tax=Dallia pectoralis TaxID=75939 RepID=A0ACC2FIK7_DALPE|nr:hypothetical protein DPEC_G00293420 [Dallia pectoralis]